MSTIKIELNPEAAAAYTSAPTVAQKKVQLLLNTWLPTLMTPATRPLREVMDQISAEAEARGLTDEILESILNERD
jgi:hypothetical protein